LVAGVLSAEIWPRPSPGAQSDGIWPRTNGIWPRSGKDISPVDLPEHLQLTADDKNGDNVDAKEIKNGRPGPNWSVVLEEVPGNPEPKSLEPLGPWPRKSDKDATNRTWHEKETQTARSYPLTDIVPVSSHITLEGK